MKKSFRLYLFFQILLATALILVTNRQLAQHFLAQQMEDRAHQEMARVLTLCGSAMADAQAWSTCNQGLDRGDVLNPLNDFFVPCPVAPAEQVATECHSWRSQEVEWQAERFGPEPVTLGKVKLDDAHWHVMASERSVAAPAVLLSDGLLWVYLKKIWALRDRNLIYVLPTIIAMLVLLTAYMVYVVMRPIRLMEKTLSTLDFKNIHEKSTIDTPYVEFKYLADVYRDLLHRLYESYENAKRFASDAAHELRTPLSILRGNVERLLAEVPQGSETQRYIQNLSDEVDRLVVITEKLLMLSRADNNSLALDLEPVPISAYLVEWIEEAATFHPHIRFDHDIQPGVVWQCDKALIEQLINNLYANAVKYNTPRGGWIQVRLQQTASEIELEVKNASAHLAPELPQKAFDRFYRGDASRTRRGVDGLGLGLSICKEIVEAHGGHIRLTVEDEHVVCIQVRAPLHRAA